MLPFFLKNNTKNKTYARLVCDILFCVITIAFSLVILSVTIITLLSSRETAINDLKKHSSYFSSDVDNWYLKYKTYVTVTTDALLSVDYTDTDIFSEKFNGLVTNSKLDSISYTCFSFEDGTNFSALSEAPDNVVSTQNWFINALNSDDVVISSPEKDGDDVFVLFSRAVTINQTKGVFMCKVSMRDLFHTLSAHYDFKKNEYSFLVDKTGYIFMHPLQANKPSNALNIYTSFDTNFNEVSSVLSDNVDQTSLFTTSDYSNNLNNSILVYCSNQSKYSNLAFVNVTKKFSFPPLYTTFMITCLIIYAILTIGIYTIIPKAISKWFLPLHSIAGKLERISVGDFSVNFEDNYTSKESQMLACSLNIAKSSLDSYLKETRDILYALSNCNLKVELPMDYEYDFIDLKNYLEIISKTLNSTFADINETALAISCNAEQMQASSEELADNSNNANNFIHESIHCIDKLLINNKIIKNKCNGMHDISFKIRGLFHSEQNLAENIIDTLSSIKKYHKKMLTITNTLNEISSQTDLLALKASIEASKIGESGKSFLKIATEIGSLAKDCTNSVQQISSLTDNLTKNVNIGAELTLKASEEISEISNFFNASTNMLNDISNFSLEQTEDLNLSLEHSKKILDIIETAKSAASENFSISDEAAKQAILLKKIIEKYHFMH